MFWGHSRPSEAIRGHPRPFEAVWICPFFNLPKNGPIGLKFSWRAKMKNHLYLKQCFEVIRGHLNLSSFDWPKMVQLGWNFAWRAKMKIQVYLKQCFEAIRGHQRPFEAIWICRFWEYLKACLKGFQTSDWAYILCGWLFSRPSFHEHVFEAKVESIVRPLEVFRGHFETKVTFDIMTLGEVICLSYMEASWVWGCSEVARGCP